ncbi:MerR family regulatory protein [Terribacillus halophilus]|uniref:MerR family regulatory protein n=1 Tax=Terribacillus halophilus TaxID=361279 RepID=A0A1G6LEA0_9BACI|nr:MerR family DNA-binding transcriptional regulator [Terribacillus halophilus]SDC41551.1 MerR family regulatory protein [Terribacillus halophilus]
MYTIKQASTLSGLSIDTIRFYEKAVFSLEELKSYLGYHRNKQYA